MLSQNQAKKWYFGTQAGLDFMTTPPTALINGTMNCSEGTACISDASGNILFYTDGMTIYNSAHLAMTNGTAMAANNNACQSSVIVKQPGTSNIYYVFLMQGNGGDFYYSIVDMSLSGGLGAVTASNVLVSSVMTEKLTATRHCNGTDVWIITHNWGNNQFSARLLTATGLSAPVNSNVGTMHNGTVNNVLGCMKVSPTGKKIGLGIWASINTFELYDFDNVTGVVSNSLVLGTTFAQAYGVEFSPDGSKFYGSCETNVGTSIYQWDMCAGTPAAIIASQYTVVTASLGVVRNGIQVATDGKIYVARNTQGSLGVINSPNLAGAACNYVDAGQTLGTQVSTRGLPNFENSLFKQAPQPITYVTNAALGCLSATLSCGSNTLIQVGCASSGFSLTSFLWKLGDPASGSANTSTLISPSHTYPAPGTYTAQLILNYSCGGGTDTVTKAIVITSPTLSCISATATCNGLGAATVTTLGGSGANSYTWMPGNLTSSVVTNVIPGTFTINMSDATGCTGSLVTNVVTPMNATPVLTVASVSICPTAAATLLASGANSYTWNPGGITGNTFTASPLTNTTYTLIGEASTCTAMSTPTVFLKTVPVVSIGVNPAVCSGQSLQLNGSGGGSYLWNGPLTFTSTSQNPLVAPVSSGNAGVYLMIVTALNGCTASATTSVLVNPIPTLALVSSTVCAPQTLSVSANSGPLNNYNWTGPNAFTSTLQNNFIVNTGTVMSGIYQVTVTNALGCINTGSINATVVEPPIPTIISNAPVCEGAVLSFTAGGGLTYLWNGPNSFSSAVQNPSIASVASQANGIYTVTATNGYCSISATKSISLYPAPGLTLAGANQICESKSFTLQATTSGSIVSFLWQGPAAFQDTLQTTWRDSCKIIYSGFYSVTVTDTNQCKASASTNIQILPKPPLSAYGATVCMQEPAILKAFGADTYTWTGPSFFLSYNSSPVVTNVSHVVPYEYTVVGTNSNNCSASIQVSVIPLPLPVPSLTVSASRACANSTIQVKGDGGVSYLWMGPGNVTFLEKEAVFLVLNTGNFLTYSLMVTDTMGCKSTTSTVVRVDPLPFGDVSGNFKSCLPFCTEYAFTPRDTIPISKYVWQLNSESFSTAQFKKCFTTAGEYSLRGFFTDINNCSSTASIVIKAYPTPKSDFDFFPENPVENTEEVVFENKSSGEGLEQWEWYFMKNEDKSSLKNGSYFFREAGLFPVALKVKNKWGCQDTLVKVVNVVPDFHLYVPNVFTPNEDGLNDVFLPMGRGIRTYHLAVFNRWGLEVFESSELLYGWDGTYKGESCKMDVYSWRILISSSNGESKEMKGHLSLVR